jgi:membrane-associated protein
MDFVHQLLWYLKPEGISHLIQTGGLLAICLVIFAETGFFALLPGDSLLVLCGIFAATLAPGTNQPLLSLAALMTVVPLCAVLGDQVGYSVGRWAGPALYRWRELKVGPIPIFRPGWLRRTEDFYSRWGVFSIVVGRWVPIVRTFAPIVAGVTKMPYKRFIPFNIVGALTWVWSMVLAGYFLPPILKQVWPNFDLATNIDKIAIAVVILSLLPIAFTVWREHQESLEGRAYSHKRGAKKAKKPAAKKRR